QYASRLYRAEATTARANVTENHEGRSASCKAVVAIWAARLLTDRMKPTSAQHALQLVIGFDVAKRLAKPVRQSRRPLFSESFNLNQHIVRRRTTESTGHTGS